VKFRYTKILYVLLGTLLLIAQFPFGAAHASSEAVQVTKTVNPSTIIEGDEADVRLNVQGSPDVSVVKPNDIILIIDRSGSMAASYPANKGEDKMKNAKDAAKGFVDLVDFGKHRVGVVDFASDVKFKGLSDNPAEIKSYVNTITAGGGTGTKAAIAKAQELLRNHRPEAQPVILLMTDGEATEPSPDSYARQVALEQANLAKGEGVVFYTIALLLPTENPETSAPNTLMRAMATTAQHHHFVLGSVGLAQIYAAIVDEIGLSSAYNVVVTDTVSSEFEIVPNSYKDNIPQPTVTGNTLTWKFIELKRDTLTLDYKIRHKTGAKVGDLSVGERDINIKYDDYIGTPHEVNVVNPSITVKYDAPTITSIVKDSGLVKGGESVTITGKNFRPNVEVKFGDKTATSLQFIDSSKIIVTTPAGVQGIVDVKVINDDSQSATGKYTYYAIPEITNIIPVEGPLAGNNEVTVEGNYFLPGATVTFGDNPASIVSITSTKIIVKAPTAEKPGTVAVSVTNPDGYSAQLPNAYSYILGPVLTSLEPDHGSTKGGDSITLMGDHFKTGAKVFFKGKEVPTTFVSDTTLTVTSPAWSSAEAVTVKVVNPDGQFAEKAQAYTYNWPQPAVTSILPNEGETTGGTLVTVTGTDFQNGAKVYFNDQLVTQATFYSSSQIKLLTPVWSTAEVVAVKVVNPDGQSAIAEQGFNYLLPPPPPAPVITAVTPDHGLMTGGENVVIEGSNFIRGAKVKLKDREVTTIFVSSKQLKITTPIWASPETVDVSVTNPGGQTVTMSQAFTFATPPPPPAPVITSISPNEGELDGGLVITISGKNFETATKVYFNDTAIQSTVYGTGQIKAVTPKWTASGPVDVKVTNSDGQSVTLSSGFKYLSLPAPTLTSITPNNGLITGGTLVTVTGSNFVNGAKLTFGNQKLVTTFVSATQLRITTPVWETAEQVDITVTNPDGQTASLSNAFTFETPPPPPPAELTSITPAEGELTGGLVVTLTGKNFDSRAKVYFNDTLVPSTLYSTTQIKLTTPQWPTSGFVDVKVVNGDGQSSTLSNAFKYLAPPPPPAPTVTSVTPNIGLNTGGTIVTVVGTNFVSGTKVKLENVEVETSLVSSTSLRIKTPAWPTAESVDVTVTNPDGQTATLAQAYTFEAPPPPPPLELTSVSPNEGELAGGLLITLTGKNFDSAAKVYFNDTVLQSTVYGTTQIKAITPARTTSGQVNVKVVNGDGQTSVLSDAFNYLSPPPPPPVSLTNVSPSEGEMIGGLVITLTGTSFVASTKVYFNDTLLQSTTYSATQIKAVTPKWDSAGPVTIKVVNPDGSLIEKIAGFTYKVPPVPSVTNVSPNQGELSGGLVITLAGVDFDTGAKVYFNEMPVQSTTYNSTQIKVSTPRWTVTGPVDIKVVNSTGQLTIVPGGFTYLAPPAAPAPILTSVTPAEGPLTGGTIITLTGQNFDSVAKVYLNDTLIQSTTYSKTSIKALTPRWPSAGPVTVKIVNVDGQSTVLVNAFTYK